MVLSDSLPLNHEHQGVEEAQEHQAKKERNALPKTKRGLSKRKKKSKSEFDALGSQPQEAATSTSSGQLVTLDFDDQTIQGVVLGKVEAGEARESTNAVKAASRKLLLPVGAEIVKVFGVDDGLGESCSRAWGSCSKMVACCDGCTCFNQVIWPPRYICVGTC